VASRAEDATTYYRALGTAARGLLGDPLVDVISSLHHHGLSMIDAEELNGRLAR
jgi:hypothetical protein